MLLRFLHVLLLHLCASCCCISVQFAVTFCHCILAHIAIAFVQALLLHLCAFCCCALPLHASGGQNLILQYVFHFNSTQYYSSLQILPIYTVDSYEMKNFNLVVFDRTRQDDFRERKVQDIVKDRVENQFSRGVFYYLLKSWILFVYAHLPCSKSNFHKFLRFSILEFQILL